MVRRFANRCDGVIVPTESAEEYLRTIGVRRRILVQPTGIDIEKFRAVPDQRIRQLRAQYSPNGEPILISISRLSQEKNIDFLLDAALVLKKTCDRSFRLLIIGDGPEQGRIKGRISELGLADTITLLGAIPPDEIPAYCRMGNIFLFASRSETQGMVILEAMASGMPVVAVRSSGIDDIIENGINGFKTPPNTTQWCARIDQLISDASLYQQLSANAESTAANYSIAHFSNNVKQYYADILTARQSSSETP
tara:strand:- start:959 stop:1714 length:756 start_codon:yes stop_codon:yes gene_type:complete